MKRAAGNSRKQSVLNPINLMESNKFQMVTPQVKITVDPEFTYTITTKVIDGSRYILIPMGEGVEVNGIDIAPMRAMPGKPDRAETPVRSITPDRTELPERAKMPRHTKNGETTSPADDDEVGFSRF